jgi:hypothetical protein
MDQTRSKSRLADLLLIIALCGLVMGAYLWLARLPQHQSFYLPLIGFTFAFVVWRAAWRRVRSMRTAPTCPECGRRFLPTKESENSTLCHECRQRTIDPIAARKARAKGLWTLVPLVILSSILVGFMVQTPYVGIYSSARFWITLLLVSLGAAAAFFAVVVAIAAAFVVARSLLSRSDQFTLRVARKSADEEGKIERVGPLIIWWSGPDDPVPMVTEQIEVARNQFERLLEEKVDLGRPLRVLCFSKRSSFVCYHRKSIPNLWNLDGLYIPSHGPTITVTTDQVPYRLNDPPRTVRLLCIFHFLKVHKGFLPPFWILHGIGNSLSNSGRLDRLEILNRKMIVALEDRSALDADLFRLKGTTILRLTRNWYEHESFSTFASLSARAWSMIEYLCGRDTPPQRREPFQAFLKDLRAKGSQEAIFQHHFGFGFEALVQQWREWVRVRGPGSYVPPPPVIQQALTTAIIPTIRNPNARIMDRIQAIREIGRVGYAMGADTLIDLLRSNNMILSPEIVWSLQSVSGHGWGHDVDRWQAWIKSVPIAAVRGEQ